MWLRVWVCECWLLGCLRGCAVVGVGVGASAIRRVGAWARGRGCVSLFFFEL